MNYCSLSRGYTQVLNESIQWGTNITKPIPNITYTCILHNLLTKKNKNNKLKWIQSLSGCMIYK